MYRRKDRDRAIRVLQDQVDSFTANINPNDPHRIFGDDILARVVVDSQMPVDIRSIEKGLLLWYNQAYIGMINKFGQTLEMVKDWNSINNIQEIESYDREGNLKDPGHGIMHSQNNIDALHKPNGFQEAVSHYMDNLYLFKSVKTHHKLQQLETHNTPVTSDGTKHPIKMINTIYWDDDLVITEFHFLNP